MGKSVVFTFGRMNPVTTGHEFLVDKLKSVSKKKNADTMIFLSHTRNMKKDPLKYDDKLKFAKLAFGNIVKSSKSRQVFEIMPELEKKGYTEVTMVVGSDRVPEFKRVLEKYNGDLYNFDKIEVISAGERDPDADDVSGMSASKMRNFVKSDDITSFAKGTPKSLNNKEIKNLFNLVAIGLREMVDTTENLETQLFEVLSRSDRIKRGRVMKRMKNKIKMKRKLAMKRRSTPEKLDKKSRKMAINTLKKKFAAGKSLSDLTPGEKARIEKRITSKKGLVDRLARKSKKIVRQTERERLSGGSKK